MITRAARSQLVDEDLVEGEQEAMQRIAQRADPPRWATVREELELGFDDTDQLNLDRKQALLSAFFAIEEAVR